MKLNRLERDKIQLLPQKTKIRQGLTIVSKPRPSYTEEAFAKKIMGYEKFRLAFGADGFISNIVVTQNIDDGLLTQTIFAAIRIRFLPQETNGKPETVVKKIEYGFEIY